MSFEVKLIFDVYVQLHLVVFCIYNDFYRTNRETCVNLLKDNVYRILGQ